MRHNIYQSHSRFILKTNKKYKVEGWLFLAKSNNFHMTFFLKFRSGQALFGWFKPLRLGYQFSTKKWKMFVPGLISHKSILNKITGVQNSIWSTAARGYLVRRKSLAGEHGSIGAFSLLEDYSKRRSVYRNFLHFSFARTVSRAQCLL